MVMRSSVSFSLVAVWAGEISIGAMVGETAGLDDKIMLGNGLETLKDDSFAILV